MALRLICYKCSLRITLNRLRTFLLNYPTVLKLAFYARAVALVSIYRVLFAFVTDRPEM